MIFTRTDDNYGGGGTFTIILYFLVSDASVLVSGGPRDDCRWIMQCVRASYLNGSAAAASSMRAEQPLLLGRPRSRWWGLGST